MESCWPLSGHEGTGRCHWCGGEFKNKRQKRFCSKACMDAYYYEYFWSWAAGKAMRDHRYCEDCGVKERRARDERGVWGFEVHHIEPLNGGYRTWNVKNRHDNLVVLCHDCHVLRHKAQPQAHGANAGPVIRLRRGRSMTKLPVTESDTLHAAQAELERLMESDDMRFKRADERQLLRLLVIQGRRNVDLYHQVQDLQRRTDKGKAGEED